MIKVLLTPLILVALLFTLAVDAATLKKTKDGLQLTIPSKNELAVRHMEIKVITNDIIQVRASPLPLSKKTSSLIVAKTPQKQANWVIKQEGNTATITTETLLVQIDATTGSLTFMDKQGKVLLQELAQGGKSFQPITIEGKSAWTFRQVFESPDNEAFYGLGQHQSDEFNYKGKNETLYQYNTKVSVPFIVSNKNYGILWDNYSLTRFGDPRPYANLDQFRLFDANGTEGGLTASYQNLARPSAQALTRIEHTVDYENLETVKNFPPHFNFGNASVKWEGSIQPKESGLYHFLLYYAGYTKVWLDDSLVVAERWRTAWNPNSYKFNAQLNSSKKHKLRIEWKPDGGVSYIGLKALSPMSEKEQGQLSFWSEMGDQLDYYFVRGNNPDKVIGGYRYLTGKAQVMPKWAMGYWQSRERYKSQEELLSTLREFRERHIPIDNIVQDWSYWKENAWGSHEADPTRFPDMKAMVQEVHDSSARIMLSVWPKFYQNTEHFKQFDAKGWMYKLAIEDSVRDWIGKGYIGSFYDAYSEGARKLFWKQMDDHLFKDGFDAWWMDASEPDILSNSSMDYRKKLMTPTSMGPSTQFFNAYGLMNAKGIYEGQRKSNNNQRVFLLTRSGFAGSQKYAAAIWSGDIGTRWEDMKAQISAGLNYSISGNPYWTMDDGGFCVEKRYEQAKEGSEDKEEWRELNVRWHQFGCFVPIFRSHGQFPYREPWNIAPAKHPAYFSMVWYNQLRYRLMPYIYSLAGACYLDDYTIMRPLMMDFERDEAVLNIGDQYMFGSQIMVCPVYQYKARTRSVYFPKEKGWYDLYTGAFHSGGIRGNIDAPYNRIPAFVPSGSILPVGKVVENTKAAQTDLTLYVYDGADGSFVLYEDENLNYNYEKGQYATIRFEWNDETKTLNISDRKGSFSGMQHVRTFNIVLVSAKNAVGLNRSNVKGKMLTYKGQHLSIRMN